MSHSRDYIPSDDCSFQFWAESLSACIAGEPEKYRFSPQDAAELAAVVRDFGTAFIEASNPWTRTSRMVAAKREARKACEAACRRFAMAIKNHPSISDADKICAGVRVPERRRSVVECPRTRPLLQVIGCSPWALTIRYADSMTPDSRAKAPGASSLNLYMGVGESVAPRDCRFIGAFTRNPIELELKEDGEWQRVTLIAQWSYARGETGPWSEPVTTAIAA